MGVRFSYSVIFFVCTYTPVMLYLYLRTDSFSLKLTQKVVQ